MKVDFDKLAAQERRLVLVASDAKYAQLVNAIDWKSVLVGGAVAMVSGGLPLLAVGGALFGSALTARGHLAATFAALQRLEGEVERRSVLQRAFTKGELPLPHLPPSEAHSRFRFDLGGPEDGAIYLLNPCVDNHYLLPAMADERLVQEKIAAFIQIACALGAKKITLHSAEQLGRHGSAKGDVPLKKAAAQAGLSVSLSSESKVERQVVAEFDKPSRAPYLVEELAPWLDMDPTLRAMVRTRLDGEASRMGVDLTLGKSIDIGAEVAAKFAERGLNVGGAYREVAATRWSFEVRFWGR